jgi:hypothetical protein
MAQSEMLVIKRSYDYSKWLLQHTGKFPKSHRFSVAVKLENAALSLIELTRSGINRFCVEPRLGHRCQAKEVDPNFVHVSLELIP